MTITRGYITLTQLKAYGLDGSTESGDDTLMEEIIQATSRMIDQLTERTFLAQTQTRLFDLPPAGRVLYLDDELLSLTSVSNSTGAIATGSLLLEPYNNPPYTEIVIKNTAPESWRPDTGGGTQRVITVVGDWGYSSSSSGEGGVPEDIKQVTKELAMALFRHRKGQSVNMAARITSAGVVMIPKGLTEMAKATLDRYTRIGFDNELYEGD